MEKVPAWKFRKDLKAYLNRLAAGEEFLVRDVHIAGISAKHVHSEQKHVHKEREHVHSPDIGELKEMVKKTEKKFSPMFKDKKINNQF